MKKKLAIVFFIVAILFCISSVAIYVVNSITSEENKSNISKKNDLTYVPNN